MAHTMDGGKCGTPAFAHHSKGDQWVVESGCQTEFKGIQRQTRTLAQRVKQVQQLGRERGESQVE